MKEAWDATKRLLLDTFAFNPTPQLVAPLVEQWSNKDFFTGRPIVGPDLERMPAWMQYRPDTSETAREVGAALNLSPERIEHFIGGYFGTLGMYILNGVDQAVERVFGYPAEPSLRIDDYPIVKRFIRADPPRNTKFINDLYVMKREADKVAAAVREMAEQGEDPGAYAEKHAGDLAVSKVLGKAAGALTKLRQAEQQIMLDRNMTSEQKRKQIDDIARERAALAKDYVGYAKTLKVMDGISAVR
jgi:hypothetical protein